MSCLNTKAKQEIINPMLKKDIIPIKNMTINDKKFIFERLRLNNITPKRIMKNNFKAVFKKPNAEVPIKNVNGLMGVDNTDCNVPVTWDSLICEDKLVRKKARNE